MTPDEIIEGKRPIAEFEGLELFGNLYPYYLMPDRKTKCPYQVVYCLKYKEAEK